MKFRLPRPRRHKAELLETAMITFFPARSREFWEDVNHDRGYFANW